MPGILRVFPHRSGPWLVRAGRLVLGVPPGVGATLQPLDDTRPGPAEIARLFPDPDPDEAALAARLAAALAGDSASRWTRLRARFPVWVRVPLVPAAKVSRMAHPLVRLTGWPALTGLLAVGLGGLVAPGRAMLPRPQGGTFILGLVLLALTVLAHELGHAAALVRSGYRPGSLGMGMLAVLPVFFVDVTPVALLPRAERMRVNAAGPVFQLAWAGLFQVLAVAISGRAPQLAGACELAAASAALAASWSLTPFIRSDGYWLVCDALGLPGLDRPTPAGASVGARVLVDLLRLGNMVFYTAAAFMITSRALEIRWPAFLVWPARCLTLGIVVTLAFRIFHFGRLIASGKTCPDARAKGGSRTHPVPG